MDLNLYPKGKQCHKLPNYSWPFFSICITVSTSKSLTSFHSCMHPGGVFNLHHPQTCSSQHLILHHLGQFQLWELFPASSMNPWTQSSSGLELLLETTLTSTEQVPVGSNQHCFALPDVHSCFSRLQWLYDDLLHRWIFLYTYFKK